MNLLTTALPCDAVRAGQPLEKKVSARFVGEPHAIPAARRALDELSPDLSPDARQRLELVVSELVANAVLHGSGGPGDWVMLEIWTGPGRLHGTVTDRGSHFRLPPQPQLGELRAGGWGLLIVGDLTDRWGLHSNAETCVWWEMDLGLAQAA